MSRTLALGFGAVCAVVLAGCGGSHQVRAAPRHVRPAPRPPAAHLSARGARSTLAEWRSNVGHGTLPESRKVVLRRDIRRAAAATGATIRDESVLAGDGGAAVYVDLASPQPIEALRHLGPLIAVAAGKRFPGGWAIRLRNARHTTVWIAGHAGTEGFVGSATSVVDSASPVSHG